MTAEPPSAWRRRYARCELLGAARGRFGAMMAVELVGDGPVTLLLEVAGSSGG